MAHWKDWETAYITEHCTDGAQAIADRLGRSVSSVQVMASRMGLALRPRWLCPHCGHITYRPLSMKTGWCRCCTLDQQREVVAQQNLAMRREVAREQSRIKDKERERQALYSDTNRQRAKLRRLRED